MQCTEKATLFLNASTPRFQKQKITFGLDSIQNAVPSNLAPIAIDKEEAFLYSRKIRRRHEKKRKGRDVHTGGMRVFRRK